ncbi:MAG: hypothetical protein E5Y74_31005 [Mesorhizobium sp.]|nr:MAG: hypothetical protein E5Y74_31005 [Mesorhizobium sp.]
MVTAAAFTVNADATADGANYRTLLVRRYRAGVATTLVTTDTIAGLTAFIPKDSSMSAGQASFGFEPGDVLTITSNSAGAGKALTDLAATLTFIEF